MIADAELVIEVSLASVLLVAIVVGIRYGFVLSRKMTELAERVSRLEGEAKDKVAELDARVEKLEGRRSRRGKA